MIDRPQPVRIQPVSPTPADPQLAAMFAEVRARGIALPNLYRVLGHSPEMLRAWLDFAWPLRLQARTPRAARELLILRGAQLAEAEYEWVHHVPMALAAGVQQAQVDEFADWRESRRFSQEERAVLRLADEMFEGPASAACVAELVQHYDTAGAVELVLTASFYVCVARFLLSAGVQLEDAGTPSSALEEPR
jgi:alkylhydroperoxidase family enzyme